MRFPENTKNIIQITSLVKYEENPVLSEHMSTRMVKSAAMLSAGEFIGWSMRVPRKGLIQMSLFASETVSNSDLEWVIEHTAVSKVYLNGSNKCVSEDLNYLYELQIPASENRGNTNIGFASEITKNVNDNDFPRWPIRYSSQFAELIKAFQTDGAELMAVIGAASKEEQLMCRRNFIKTWNETSINSEDYLGIPVRTRCMLRLPSKPSIRLLAVLDEAIPGVRLISHGLMTEENCKDNWRNPLGSSLVLPDYAARIMVMEPRICESMVGVEISERRIPPIPVSHKNPNAKEAITIGRAVATSGEKRRITIADIDLRRHYQIIGQTGTGKSTLLSTMILSAIQKGYGLTFFDPHGSTIDGLLESIPMEYADKVRVVRIGDVDNSVPLNIWESDDPEKEERTISDLCELFGDLFDPHREGIVGPRYERWLSTFCKAAIAFLGRRASFEAISVISQSQDNMLKVSKAIYARYPELVEIIKEEYGKDKSNDFHSLLNWYLCKLQRLTSVEQLRKTLGAGTNALDFAKSIDTDTVTLIDLSSPEIGTPAARVVGTLLLMKLWNAALVRKNCDKTHLVVVDEASLFQTNPMPRMLAESRKFGISVVFSHQHTGQLTMEIKDALESNSANFSSFRLSPRDAVNATLRFENSDMKINLARLDAYNAITTLSINGQQTAPFTLETLVPQKQPNGAEIARIIEKNSVERLVKPYESLRALTKAEVQDYLNHPEKLDKNYKTASSETVNDEQLIDEDEEILLQSNDPDKKPEWLVAWNKHYTESLKAG